MTPEVFMAERKFSLQMIYVKTQFVIASLLMVSCNTRK